MRKKKKGKWSIIDLLSFNYMTFKYIYIYIRWFSGCAFYIYTL